MKYTNQKQRHLQKHFLVSAFDNSQTCFVTGECRESHHIAGQQASDQFQCLENCHENTGIITKRSK